MQYEEIMVMKMMMKPEKRCWFLEHDQQVTIIAY